MRASRAEIKANAEIIWHYHQLNHTLRKADCILVLGSNDVRVAHRAAQLYQQGYAPLLVFSGAVGKLTEGLFKLSEGEHFAQIAMQMGVPKDAILIENKATNTGENIQFIQQLLAKHQIAPASFIVVQKPFMERRAYAVFRQYISNVPLIITSPQIALQDYANDVLTYDDILNVMVGDLQRIKEYPVLGFQIYQAIPDHVWLAFENLCRWGYNKHLITE